MFGEKLYRKTINYRKYNLLYSHITVPAFILPKKK